MDMFSATSTANGPRARTLDQCQFPEVLIFSDAKWKAKWTSDPIVIVSCIYLGLSPLPVTAATLPADYYIFSRESQAKPSFATGITGRVVNPTYTPLKIKMLHR